MPSVDFVVSSEIIETPRVKQLSGMFDMPLERKLGHRWQADIPIDDGDWNIGLIVGPSGAGKSLVGRELFGADTVDVPLDWHPTKSLVDCFSEKLTIKEITEACSAVGFNTIPSWLKPFRVLSNGEQFRADLARRLLELPDPIVVDEFTSIVDRQVAQIGSHAVQKFVRRHNRKFVAIACHFDIIDWLQPDWIFNPHTCEFHRRLLRRRPDIEISIKRVDKTAWKFFSRFHYMNESLNPSARCYVLYVNEKPAAFASILFMPISNKKAASTRKPIYKFHRLVTLPDWQGLGLMFTLCETMASAHAALGRRVRTYPAHPSFVKAHDRSPKWALLKKPNNYVRHNKQGSRAGAFGGRPCSIFQYAGEPMDDAGIARRLIEG